MEDQMDGQSFIGSENSPHENTRFWSRSCCPMTIWQDCAASKWNSIRAGISCGSGGPYVPRD